VRGVLNCMRNDPRLPEGWWMGKKARKGKKKRKKKGTPHLASVTPLPVRPADPGCPAGPGVEHGAHWYGPAEPDEHHTRWHCLGWHAVNREIREVPARFHLPYVRGRQSNLVHRSTGEGTVTWFPGGFHDGRMAYAALWQVKPVCPLPALKNPATLDADGVRSAEPRDLPSGTSQKYAAVTLCARCFPTGGTE